MQVQSTLRVAAVLAMSVTTALTWAQTSTPSPVPAASAPAPVASAAMPAASNPLLVLPQWAQDKVVAARQDPKLLAQAYKQGAKVATFCANCHGPAGHSVRPEVPNLAGQNMVYVLNQLNKFHDGRRRGNFFMEGLVKAMSNDERFAVAVYYTDQEPASFKVSDPALAATGQALYEEACKRCHGASGAGSERNSRIAGQHPSYLDMSLRRYRQNQDRSEARMFKATKALNDQEIKALSAYIGSLR
ncbi:MAG TPA: c-type cytochrome [Ramlibacter sp.]|nr:c-type cytochrome [Ramlibacter sp.]